MFKKIYLNVIHHPNILAWFFIASMVAIMATYNTVIRYGFDTNRLTHLLFVYPLIVIFIYCLRTYITLPLVLKIYPINAKVSRSVGIPFCVIMLNVSVMMLLFTFTHKLVQNNFLLSYFENWVKTVFVAIPVFFFVVRPAISNLFTLLRKASK